MEPKNQEDNVRPNPNNSSAQKEGEINNVKKAHVEADKDIASDPEFSAHSPNDDLDEGETARLGENNTGLV